MTRYPVSADPKRPEPVFQEWEERPTLWDSIETTTPLFYDTNAFRLQAADTTPVMPSSRGLREQCATWQRWLAGTVLGLAVCAAVTVMSESPRPSLPTTAPVVQVQSCTLWDEYTNFPDPGGYAGRTTICDNGTTVTGTITTLSAGATAAGYHVSDIDFTGMWDGNVLRGTMRSLASPESLVQCGHGEHQTPIKLMRSADGQHLEGHFRNDTYDEESCAFVPGDWLPMRLILSGNGRHD